PPPPPLFPYTTLFRSRSLALPQMRVEQIAQGVAQEIKAKADHEDRDAGHRCHPPLVEDEFATGGDHGAPFRQRRLGAEADKAQSDRKSTRLNSSHVKI